MSVSSASPIKPVPEQNGSRQGITPEERMVIFASSLGTVFEWYDFYLYGSLSALIGKHFFTGLTETNQFIFALLAFAAGFAVRPFGALVFGRLGDMIGRKYTFLITILIMGSATAVVGMLPGFTAIGIAAPIILIVLRLLQGLALGGEYGGAATYVAEHAPKGKRGSFTSWIQTTATVGLFLSLLVILGCRLALTDKVPDPTNPAGPAISAFDAWGWRIPFLISVALLAVSVYIRLKLNESPVFKKMKSEGKASKAPLTESFLRWGNLKIVLMVLFGGVAGQAVVWYTGMFYELFFLTQTLKVEAKAANIWVAIALMAATPFFIIFGSLSDKIGRKWIIMAGCVIAALTYFPIFRALTEAANPALAAAQASSPAKIVADPSECSFQFNPTGTAKFTSSCDVAKSSLAKAAVPYSNATGTGPAKIVIGATEVVSYDAKAANAKEEKARFEKELGAALTAANYPKAADLTKANVPMVIFLLFLLALYVTMVYAPMAAWLVEMFPARIRYTSMSLPYHIGNGWFGGFLPTIAFAITASTGDIYAGLWYPIGVALITAVIGSILMPETKDRDIHHDA